MVGGRGFWILVWYGILVLGLIGLWASVLWGRRLKWQNLDEFLRAIGTVQVAGLDMGRLATWLETTRHIVTVRIKHDEFDGLRITPNVYTTLEEIDRFCEAMESAITHGIPPEEDANS
jgi:hypothetical protein